MVALKKNLQGRVPESYSNKNQQRKTFLEGFGQGKLYRYSKQKDLKRQKNLHKRLQN